MNLQHLCCFVEIAHQKNYAAAAETLHITQPTLTYSIRQLEDELGIPLFVKNGRNNVLTSYGEKFLAYAEGAIKTINLGKEAIYDTIHEETVIRLGFLRFLGIRYIPGLINVFKAKYPHYKVRFECETGSTKLLLDALGGNRFDAVFCAPAQQVQKYGTCVGIQKLYLIVPNNHPLSKQKSVKLDEAIEYPFIYYTRGSSMRHIIERSYPGLWKRLNIAYELMEENVVAGFVASSLGIGIVSRLNLLETLPVTALEIESPVIERDIYMVPTVTRELTPALRDFLKFTETHGMDRIVPDKRNFPN